MENRNNATVWIVAVGCLGLLLGCIGGVLLGGLGAYSMASSARSYGDGPYYEYMPAPTLIMPEQVVPDWRMPERAATPAPAQPMAGAYAMVISVVPGSPAEEAGLQPGDMIMAINGREMSANTGPADVVAGLEPGDNIEITVQRGNRTLTLDAMVGSNPDDAGTPWLGITYRTVQGMPGGSREYQGD